MNPFHIQVVRDLRSILTEPLNVRRFDAIALPHLGAAYKLARWLIRDDQAAEDVVQEAFLSAFRSFDGFHGEEGKAWILTIVRNACYRWLRNNKSQELNDCFDEELHSLDESSLPVGGPDNNPESCLMRTDDRRLVCEALASLPLEFREVILLRELEGFSYKEIADIVSIPVGTVMSRLARARGRMRKYLMRKYPMEMAKEAPDGV